MVEVVAGRDEWEELPMMGAGIARVYEAFADGKKGGVVDGMGVAGYRDFEHAVERHRLIEGMWKRFDRGE